MHLQLATRLKVCEAVSRRVFFGLSVYDLSVYEWSDKHLFFCDWNGSNGVWQWPRFWMHLMAANLIAPDDRCGSRLCKNVRCFVCVTGQWVWMIYRGVFCGFVDLFVSRGLVGRDLRFRAVIWPDRGANGRRRAPMPRSSLRSAGRCP